MITSTFEVTTASANRTYNGSQMKNIVAALVANIPFLSIETEASDTTSLYDCTLAYSFDSAAKVRVYNSSSSIAVVRIENGTALPNATYTSFLGTPQHTLKFFVGDDVTVVAIKRSDTSSYSSGFLTFGKAHNLYDTATPTVSPTSSMGKLGIVDGMDTSTIAGNELSVAPAYAHPYGRFGSATVYSAVPLYAYLNKASKGVSAFLNGNDGFYLLYANSNGLSFGVGELEIDGHTFFVLPHSNGNECIAIRLS